MACDVGFFSMYCSASFNLLSGFSWARLAPVDFVMILFTNAGDPNVGYMTLREWAWVIALFLVGSALPWTLSRKVWNTLLIVSMLLALLVAAVLTPHGAGNACIVP